MGGNDFKFFLYGNFHNAFKKFVDCFLFECFGVIQFGQE